MVTLVNDATAPGVEWDEVCKIKAWSEPEEEKFYAYCIVLKEVLEKFEKVMTGKNNVEKAFVAAQGKLQDTERERDWLRETSEALLASRHLLLKKVEKETNAFLETRRLGELQGASSSHGLKHSEQSQTSVESDLMAPTHCTGSSPAAMVPLPAGKPLMVPFDSRDRAIPGNGDERCATLLSRDS